MKVKQGLSLIWLFLKIPVGITISMESSRRDLFINMVVDRFIFKNNQMTLSPCFTFIPKTGMGLPKSGISFYWVCLHELFSWVCNIKVKSTVHKLYLMTHPDSYENVKRNFFCWKRGVSCISLITTAEYGLIAKRGTRHYLTLVNLF